MFRILLPVFIFVQIIFGLPSVPEKEAKNKEGDTKSFNTLEQTILNWLNFTPEFASFQYDTLIESSSSDPGPEEPLTFFFRTMTTTRTMTEMTTSTSTLFDKCYTAEVGIEDCDRRRRSSRSRRRGKVVRTRPRASIDGEDEVKDWKDLIQPTRSAKQFPSSPLSLSNPEDEAKIASTKPELNQQRQQMFLEKSIGSYEWAERAILGLGKACIDPKNVGHRFLTRVVPTTLTTTMTRLVTTRDPVMRTVKFAADGGCFPKDIKEFMEECSSRQNEEQVLEFVNQEKEE